MEKKVIRIYIDKKNLKEALQQCGLDWKKAEFLSEGMYSFLECRSVNTENIKEELQMAAKYVYEEFGKGISFLFFDEELQELIANLGIF